MSEARTKDYYLKAATTILNEASRINPGFPPLFLARGVLYLLRASLLPPSTGKITGSQEQSERVTTLMQAMKSFEDASRVSQGKNVLAVMGKARAQYALGKYGDALAGYQDVLQRLPMLQDPDPRIGIGCCLWQLGFKDDAKVAWERAVEVVSDGCCSIECRLLIAHRILSPAWPMSWWACIIWSPRLTWP